MGCSSSKGSPQPAPGAVDLAPAAQVAEGSVGVEGSGPGEPPSSNVAMKSGSQKPHVKEWVKGMGMVPDLTDPPEITEKMSNDIQSSLRMAMAGREWDTFYPEVAISYATAQRREKGDVRGAGPGMAMAAAVLHALANVGIMCASTLQVPAGSNVKTFLQKIESRYSNCKVLIVLVSEALFRSIPCMNEVHKAMKADIKIVKLRVPGDDSLLPVKARQWPDYLRGAKHMIREIQDVREELGRLNCIPARGSFFAPENIEDWLKTLGDMLADGTYGAKATIEMFGCTDPRVLERPEQPRRPPEGAMRVPGAPKLLPSEEPFDWEKPRYVCANLYRRVRDCVCGTICQEQDWASMQPEVLICYSPQKRPCDRADSIEAGAGFVMAAALTHGLAEHGVKAGSRLCMGDGDADASYLDKIKLDSSQCRVMLVLLTSELYTSERCFTELSEAMKKDVRLVPLRVEADDTLLKKHARWAEGLLPEGLCALPSDTLLEVENILEEINKAATFPKAKADTFFSISKIEGFKQTDVERNLASLAEHVKSLLIQEKRTILKQRLIQEKRTILKQENLKQYAEAEAERKSASAEAERVAAERVEAERVEAERVEAERVAAGALEKQRKRDEARAAAKQAGNELHLQMFHVADQLDGKLSNLRQAATGGNAVVTRFEAKDMVFGLSEHAAEGVERYMCVSADEVRAGMNRGVQGIADEVEAHGTATDKECLHYLLHEEAGSNGTTFQGGLKRDCDEYGRLLPTRRRADGRGMRLADFVAHETARAAHLEEAHVVGVRLYTMAAFRTINDYLRDQDRFAHGKPHPLPYAALKPDALAPAIAVILLAARGRLTVAWIRDALAKLRKIEAKSARKNEVLYLYRGLSGVRIQPDFLSEGGTELAPMSTTSSLKIAMQYSASERSLLLRIRTKNFMSRGPLISFLSAFPAEEEFLFPPLTYLQPIGLPQELRVDDALFTVLELEPTM